MVVNRVFMKFVNPFAKENLPRTKKILVRVLFGFSLALNVLTLLLLAVGLGVGPNAVSASAADNPNVSVVGEPDNLPSNYVIENPLSLDLGDGGDYVVQASNGRYIAVPSSISSASLTNWLFDGVGISSSSSESNLFPTGSNYTGLGPFVEVYSANPGVMPDTSMPAVYSWLSGNATYYFGWGYGGGLVWTTNTTTYTIGSVSIEVGFSSWPGSVIGSSISMPTLPFVRLTFTYNNLSFLNVDGSISTLHYSGLVNPYCVLRFTSTEGGNAGFSGTFEYTCAYVPYFGSNLVGLYNTESSTSGAWSDIRDYLPISTSTAGSFSVSASISGGSGMALAGSPSAYSDFSRGDNVANGAYGDGYVNGYGTGYDKGNSDGYNNGYDAGYSAGESAGMASADPVTSFSGLVGVAIDGVANVLNLEIFGLSLGTWVCIPLLFGILFAVVKLFNKGG